jgi:sarcosine oxidase gamma subunit
LLRRDVNGIEMYQFYAGREFGEYLWEVLVETAREVGGGPVGTEALLGLREAD